MKITHTEDYQELRRREYPPIEDWADALYWQSKGNSTPMQAYFARVATVKEKYPKDLD